MNIVPGKKGKKVSVVVNDFSPGASNGLHQRAIKCIQVPPSLYLCSCSLHHVALIEYGHFAVMVTGYLVNSFCCVLNIGNTLVISWNKCRNKIQ